MVIHRMFGGVPLCLCKGVYEIAQVMQRCMSAFSTFKTTGLVHIAVPPVFNGVFVLGFVFFCLFKQQSFTQ